MQRADYIHSSAAIRVKEKGLLNQSYFLRLTDLESAEIGRASCRERV